MSSVRTLFAYTWLRIHTETEYNRQNHTTSLAKHQVPGIINTIHFMVANLEGTDNIVRPRRDTRNSTQAKNARDHAQGMESCWYGEDTQPKLGFHHENDCSHESYLASCQLCEDSVCHVYLEICVHYDSWGFLP